MAKMFYTEAETKYKLKTIDDNVFKSLVQEGELREFRDGKKILFKMDEVDDLIEKRENAKNETVYEEID